MADTYQALKIHRKLFTEFRKQGLSSEDANRAAIMQMTQRPTEQMKDYAQTQDGVWHRILAHESESDAVTIRCTGARVLPLAQAGWMPPKRLCVDCQIQKETPHVR